MPKVLEFRQVSLQLQGNPVLQDFSFVVEEGNKMVLTGPSGVGKTTVIRLISGFHIPDQGEILLFGRKLTNENIREIRKQIFWLPQNFNPGNGIVRDLLNSILGFRRNREDTLSEGRIKDILTDLFLPDDILERRLETLSGGQLQRVGLGLGLAINRPVILLDEPTSQLDGRTKEKAAERYLNRKDITLISASHDPAWIDQMSQTVKLDSNADT